MKKELESQIVLLTPTGKVSVPVQITYFHDVIDGIVRNEKCEISLTYNEKEYKGEGKSYIGEDPLLIWKTICLRMLESSAV